MQHINLIVHVVFSLLLSLPRVLCEARHHVRCSYCIHVADLSLAQAFIAQHRGQEQALVVLLVRVNVAIDRVPHDLQIVLQ